ncbi:hypothetical protein SAMN05518861_11678 [Mesorhizobium sp. YR577]|nr:hypothetical protein SAMN05518861_11678 [Mesorhizobium sp. YR577]
MSFKSDPHFNGQGPTKDMNGIRYSSKETLAKLRQTDAQNAKGKSMAKAIRSIAMTEVTYRCCAGGRLLTYWRVIDEESADAINNARAKLNKARPLKQRCKLTGHFLDSTSLSDLYRARD